MGRGMEGGGYGGEMGMAGGGWLAVAGGGFDAERRTAGAHWLLRFFDFSVEPGKKYKYRVRLVMLDPNQSSAVRIRRLRFADRRVMKRIRAGEEGQDAVPS